MTAHWRDKEKWLYGANSNTLNEIWDGSMYADVQDV